MTTLTHVLSASGRFCWRLSPLFRALSVVIYYIVGVYYYHSTEDWTVIDSVYFVTVSVATIGYGDLHPTSDKGRLFTSFYLIAGLLFVLSAVDELVRHGILKYQSAVMEQVFPDLSLKVSAAVSRCLLSTMSDTTIPFVLLLQDRSVKKLIGSVSILTILAALGVLFFTLNEGWSPSKAIYWTVGTMMVSRQTQTPYYLNTAFSTPFFFCYTRRWVMVILPFLIGPRGKSSIPLPNGLTSFA